MNSCAGSSLPPILEFDASGKLLKALGANLFVFPHSILMDKDGNLWLTDGQDKDGKGHQVLKLSQQGKVLMTLGKAGVPVDRKVLSDLAIHEPAAFEAIVDKAKAALAA